MKDNIESVVNQEEEVIMEYSRLALKFSTSEIAKQKGLSKGTVSRILKGVLPKTKKLRLKLRLPAYKYVLVCPGCGEPHIRKCWKLPTKPRKPREKKYTLKQILMVVEYGHKTNLNLEDTLLNVRHLLADL